MDPINLLVLINLFVTLTANLGGAKKGFKTSIIKTLEKPKTYLQKVPPNISALILILVILGVFKLGTFDDLYDELMSVRVIGLVLFVLFSWIQIRVYKSLGDNYSQEIVVLNKHELKTDGFYRLIRHPQYLSQFLSDLGAGVALFSYLAVPMVILVELPLLILRAIEEEKLLKKHFGEEFDSYKKQSGFLIPFIG